MDESIDLLTEREKERVILALAHARETSGKRPFTAKRAAKALSWANRVRLEAAMLNLVLKGVMSVDVGPGDRVIWALIDEENRIGNLSAL